MVVNYDEYECLRVYRHSMWVSTMLASFYVDEVYSSSDSVISDSLSVTDSLESISGSSWERA